MYLGRFNILIHYWSFKFYDVKVNLKIYTQVFDIFNYVSFKLSI